MILAAARKWEQVPRWVLWTAAVVCIVFASFRVWSAEHEKYLAEVERNKPQFILSFGQLFSREGPKSDVTWMMIQTTLLNRGAESVAIGWKAHYKSLTEEKDLEVTVFPEEIKYFNIPDSDMMLVLKKSDLIIVKTHTAIKRGQIVSGLLLIDIPRNMFQEVSKGTAKVIISTEDYLGNRYNGEFKGSQRKEKFKYFPGAEVLYKNKIKDAPSK
jgi:hypothetical protein